MEELHGGDIYRDSKIRLDFSVNTNPLGMPEEIRKAVKNSAEYWERYPDCQCRSLRRALTEYYGGETAPAHFICGNGASDLFYTLAFALRPKKALVPAPSFSEYELALRAAGCEVERFYTSERSSFSLEEGNDFLRCIRESSGIDMIIAGNPNNPTGIALNREWIIQLSGLCREKGIFLVLDECFNWFLKEREDFSIVSLIRERPREYRHVLAVNAFTKIYAMAGLRFGYAVCTDEEIIRKMENCRQPWSVSAPGEAAAKAALFMEDWIDKTVMSVEREREFLTEELKKLGFTVFPSMVNYLLFKTAGNVDYKRFCRNRGILIRSCENFEGLDSRYYRTAVRLRGENEELLRCLKAAGGRQEWQK